MSAQSGTSSARGHAAPARHEVSKLALWFGILAAPTAWLLDQMLDYGVASQVCAAQSAATTAQLVRASAPWFLWFTGATFLIALVSCRVAYRNWCKTRTERSGSGHHLLQSGEGRTRFLAMCGLITSISFSVAFLFTAAYMMVAPLCAK
jgi:hypothetical protein